MGLFNLFGGKKNKPQKNAAKRDVHCPYCMTKINP